MRQTLWTVAACAKHFLDMLKHRELVSAAQYRRTIIATRAYADKAGILWPMLWRFLRRLDTIQLDRDAAIVGVVETAVAIQCHHW